MSGEKITARFSPSPTGKLHLGSLRTALISFMTSDDFVLRIEDTDAKRSTKESEQEIIDTFKWLEIPVVGEVVRQSEQQAKGVYNQIADALVQSGYAYYCNCSVEELRNMKTQQIKNKERRLGYAGKCRAAGNTSGVIRLNSYKIGEDRGDKFFRFHDNVFGDRRVDFRDVPDAVLLRANGTATYILANTIDDMQADVDYIARGADIITQTATQIALREAVHWAINIPAKPVQYSHLPLILGGRKEKLSKRNPDTKAILEYKAEGYLKEAIMQFVLSLGNSSISTHKAMSVAEIREAYDIGKLGRKDTAFLDHKLLHLNGLHIKSKTAEELQKCMVGLYDTTYPLHYLDAFKSRVGTLKELHLTCRTFQAHHTADLSAATDLKATGFTDAACAAYRTNVLQGMRTPPLNLLVK